MKSDPGVQAVFEQYPDTVRPQMERLRQLVISVARETNGISELEETLKWGEPSYLTKQGSTLRMDWKAKTPAYYALYFQCTSQLVPTFRVIYPDLLRFEGNRAVVFALDASLPEQALKKCIATTLQYHKLKNQPLLGL